MSTVNIKYLKDENGNKISPVTSTQSVYNSSGKNLDQILVNATSSTSGLMSSTNYSTLQRIDNF